MNSETDILPRGTKSKNPKIQDDFRKVFPFQAENSVSV
ncbi:hypothetical protein CSC02_4562 [Enterobacter hormaechei subsp. hoffmannii]|nr:hypothetical protein CSC02_4562 [Enterobacter hormaechei subsp. hoffmannii]